MVEEKRKIEEYYQALINRDSQYTGIFYVGVKTTQIFCISTCRARKPKLENVNFYESIQEVENAGFRPCKVCKPTKEKIPEELMGLIKELQANPNIRITDQDLLSKGLQPATVRRWFKAHYGTTFQTFQKQLRMNRAVEQLQTGESVTTSAFSSGYESLSGFHYYFQSTFDHSPSEATTLNMLSIDKIHTPIGQMVCVATAKAVCLLEFEDRWNLEEELHQLERQLDAKLVNGRNSIIEQAETELQEYFEGKRKVFEVPLEMPGTVFQQRVWNALLAIPYGDTRSYKQQSIALGDIKAIRAVASANGQNRIAIMVPCHRVVGSDGSLTGYAGGIPRKRWLLDHESSQPTLFS